MRPRATVTAPFRAQDSRSGGGQLCARGSLRRPRGARSRGGARGSEPQNSGQWLPRAFLPRAIVCKNGVANSVLLILTSTDKMHFCPFLLMRGIPSCLQRSATKTLAEYRTASTRRASPKHHARHRGLGFIFSSGGRRAEGRRGGTRSTWTAIGRAGTGEPRLLGGTCVPRTVAARRATAARAASCLCFFKNTLLACQTPRPFQI